MSEDQVFESDTQLAKMLLKYVARSRVDLFPRALTVAEASRTLCTILCEHKGFLVPQPGTTRTRKILAWYEVERAELKCQYARNMKEPQHVIESLQNEERELRKKAENLNRGIQQSEKTRSKERRERLKNALDQNTTSLLRTVRKAIEDGVKAGQNNSDSNIFKISSAIFRDIEDQLLEAFKVPPKENKQSSKGTHQSTRDFLSTKPKRVRNTKVKPVDRSHESTIIEDENQPTLMNLPKVQPQA